MCKVSPAKSAHLPNPARSSKGTAGGLFMPGDVYCLEVLLQSSDTLLTLASVQNYQQVPVTDILSYALRTEKSSRPQDR